MRLENLREEIDAVDAEIVRLYIKRMDLTRQVGECKKASGKPVYDSKREAEKIASLSAAADDPDVSNDIARLYEFIMEQSRKQQEKIVGE